MQLTDLTQFSSRALLDGIGELLGSEREITAKLLAHLGEVEERRLHLEWVTRRCSTSAWLVTR